MEVLLLILKIIGICLLALLGLFLFLILSIIFIPVRYRIRGRGETPGIVETDAVFSWFLHIIHARVRYDGGGTKIRIRIFGIPISLGKGKKKEKKRKGKKRKPDKTVVNTEENTAEVHDGEEIDHTQESSAEAFKEELTETVQIPIIDEGKSLKEKKDAEASEKKYSKKRTVKKKFSIKEKIKDLKIKIFHWKEQLGNIKSIILEETNRNAVGILFREFKFLMKHYMPRKVSGELMFGMEDPAATGQVLGIISMLPFWYRYKISVMPDFTAEHFYVKGTFDMKGRIRSIHLLVSGIRFIKNKDIRKLIKQIRR